jgi:hypothetical protein
MAIRLVRVLSVAALVSAFAFASPADSQPTAGLSGGVQGILMAESVHDERGDWKYTLQVSWFTGAPQALSHLDLLLGLSGCECVCTDFRIGEEETVGTSGGLSHLGRSCTVSYTAEFECRGDPSIAGEEGPIIKFSPVEGSCMPMNGGTGIFVFYSDWPPAPLEQATQSLLIKYGTKSMTGALAGVLPSCRCATSTQSTSWGDVKKMFR